jgi:CMP/dCMP kinase
MRVVTIDGPAGAGKSTVSKRLADRLKWRLLDTGAMYRAIALAALRARIDLHDDSALGALASQVSVMLPPGAVLLDGEDVSREIRTIEVTRATSAVADRPSVRRRLVELQRTFAAEFDTVTEGRDQGTIVFPDALVKFFVTASVQERARRRHAEFLARGELVSEDAVARDVAERDARDIARTIAPMKPAEHALIVDTTGLNLDDVLAHLEREVRARLALEPAGDAS